MRGLQDSLQRSIQQLRGTRGVLFAGRGYVFRTITAVISKGQCGSVGGSYLAQILHIPRHGFSLDLGGL